MKKIKLLFLFLPLSLFSQDDLLNEIDTDSTGTEYADSAFKALKIVNFESTKLAAKKDFFFVVSHRFGSIKGGFKELFGLDQSVTRLHFIYGLSDGINLGVSRSAFQKTYEFSGKYRLVRQKKENGSPVTVVGFNSISINTLLDDDVFPNLEFGDRLGFTSQVLISRKFNKKLSLQLIPTLLHENLVDNPLQDNTQFILGFGGRHKISKRVSVNIDYGLHFNRENTDVFRDPLSIGFDIETGGHVFQVHFSNAQPSFERGYLTQAAGDWGDGDIFFGFNLSRVF
ncbi:MAG: hypothetical protein HRT68_13705 [Flavobacteriaceae bacterium]|nr:hypothetical protein [Flavobacteriaceae bacterium]